MEQLGKNSGLTVLCEIFVTDKVTRKVSGFINPCVLVVIFQSVLSRDHTNLACTLTGQITAPLKGSDKFMTLKCKYCNRREERTYERCLTWLLLNRLFKNPDTISYGAAAHPPPSKA